jgi:hypothetical protein
MGLLNFLNAKGREVKTPPPSLDASLDARAPIPAILYAFTQRREPHAGISFTSAPDSQFNELLPETIGWQEAPEPVRFSDFFAEGNKIKPNPSMRITSHLAIGTKESVMQDTFRIGKLQGYYYLPQYAGRQLPWGNRTNIQPPDPTTYGSLYEIQGTPQQAALVTANGFTDQSLDGYPY